MLKITFEYQDCYNFPNWSKQTCVVSSVQECKKIYGLDMGGVEYHILSVEEVNKHD